MSRRLLSLLAATAVLFAACSGSSSATPTPADPRAILTGSTTALQNLKSVHFKVALSGTVDASGLLGGADASSAPGASPTTLDLSGTTIEGDLDITDSSGQVSATVPAMLNLSASVIAVGGTAYIKTNLTGPQYEKLDLSSLTSALPLPSLSATDSPAPEASAVLSDIEAELAKLPAPTQLADETVNGQACHHIQEKLTSADFPQASGVLDGTSGSLTVDVWTQTSDSRPSRVVVAVDAGSQGNVTITIDLTNYDAAVTIAAPPADQVSDQPFTIPGLGQ